MGAYIVRRLLQSVGTIVVLSVLFFLLVRFQPVNPCGGVAAMGCQENLHLDQPLATQYLIWVGNMLHGNFGSDAQGFPIGTLVLQKLPPTILLVAVSLVIQQLIALPLGILAAVRPYGVLDGVFTFLSYVALSLPAFLVGFVLLFIFVVQWPVLPLGHYEDPTVPLMFSADWFTMLRDDPGYLLGDLLRHLLLPVTALTLTGIAIDSRFMRAAMLQVLRQEYIRTARAKGISRRRIIFKHAFRNALLPIVTNLGLYLPALIGGVVVVEDVFTWGGLGNTFSQAISGTGYGVGPDFSIVETLSLLSALAVIVANLLADLAYAWLDPRIRFERGTE